MDFNGEQNTQALLSHGETSGTSYKIVELNRDKVESLGLLKEVIRKNRGTIDILAHPFYVSDESEKMFPTTKEYYTSRDQFLMAAVEEERPAILFDEARNFDKLRLRIVGGKGTLYVVTTADDNPLPVSVEEYKNNKYSQGDETRWIPILNLFKDLGITHAIVGGKYLMLRDPFFSSEKKKFEELKGVVSNQPNSRAIIGKGILPTGCPGIVMQHLMRSGIDVSVSKIAHPQNQF